ncbi:hypothetical protein ABZP36_022351 [Zizania latifolia]
MTTILQNPEPFRRRVKPRWSPSCDIFAAVANHPPLAGPPQPQNSALLHSAEPKSCRAELKSIYQRRPETMKTCHLLALLFAFAAVLGTEAASSSSGRGSIANDLTPRNCTRVPLPGVSCLDCEDECVRLHPNGVGYCPPKPKPPCECAYNCYQPPMAAAAAAAATSGK